MDDSNKVLSQNYIDSIFAQVPVEESPKASSKPAADAVVNTDAEIAAGAPSNMATTPGGSYTVAEVKLSNLDSSVKQVEIESPIPVVGSPPPPAVNVAGGDAVGTIIADMSNRLARVESAMAKVERIETAIDGLYQLEAVVARISNNHPKIKEFQNVVAHIKQINTQIKGMNANLQSTLNYGLHKSFACTCGSHGLVANRVKCTQCGREIWQGWWPKKR